MKTLKYAGLNMRQRTDQSSPTFFAFYATAKAIAGWASVQRTHDKPGAVQRALRGSRLSGIRRFLQANSTNTLPNNILIAFEQQSVTYTDILGQSKVDLSNGCDVQVKLGEISFEYDPNGPETERPAVVVDGQHRLFGAASFESENVPLLVVAMLDSSHVEQAFQFIVINNKAVRVPTTTVKSIVADYEELEASLIDRLIPAGITYGKHSALLIAVGETAGSPFEGLLDWDRNRSGQKLVAISAIQAMVTYVKSELQLIIERDNDSIEQIFIWMWAVIKDKYSVLWNNQNTQFFSKVNLTAMNEYCVDRLRSLASMQMLDLFSEDDVSKTTRTAFQNIPEELWQTDWVGVQIQDNRVVRDLLKSSFEQVAANCIREKPWGRDLKLFSAEQE